MGRANAIQRVPRVPSICRSGVDSAPPGRMPCRPICIAETPKSAAAVMNRAPVATARPPASLVLLSRVIVRARIPNRHHDISVNLALPRRRRVRNRYAYAQEAPPRTQLPALSVPRPSALPSPFVIRRSALAASRPSAFATPLAPRPSAPLAALPSSVSEGEGNGMAAGAGTPQRNADKPGRGMAGRIW
jgi:hypothetical protein